MSLPSTPTMSALYERLRHMPFPRLGIGLEDFLAFDAVLAGLASRAARGEKVGSVGPHAAAALACATLKRKKSRSRDDEAFIAYFELLDRIRVRLGEGRGL